MPIVRISWSCWRNIPYLNHRGAVRMGRSRCDRMLVTSASGQRGEREAGRGDAEVTGVDSPNQRIDVHCLFFRASARWALNQSPVG